MAAAKEPSAEAAGQLAARQQDVGEVGSRLSDAVKELSPEAAAAIEKGQATQLTDVYRKNPGLVTPRTIAQAAKAGDGYALSLWQQVGHMLGIAVGNLIYTFNPEMIYLAGGVAQAKNLILKPLWKTLEQRPFKTPINAVTIKVADNTPTIGVIGAALL